ncbi:restriction endonuclease subunit S [Ensifer adhaerens]|uniref:restriction endonuclease subunit S n=1 Tax=Ensifer adhaerens TaxID=106592 RepID=UPI003D033EA9
MRLPMGWAVTTLGECQGKTSNLDPRHFACEEFELFSVPSYSLYKPERVVGAEVGSTKQELRPRDVLLCKIVPHIRRGWVVPAVSNKRQIGSGEWIVLRDHGLDPDFLRRFILSDEFHREFMKTTSGVGGSLIRARPADAAKIAVPVPPTAEQRRIIAKLDALTARIARARAELDQVPALARKIRESTVEGLISGRVKSWKKVSLETLLSAGPTNGWSPKSGPDASGTLTLKLTATTSGYLRTDKAAVKRIYETVPEDSNLWLEPGDLLIQRANALEHVGAAAVFAGQRKSFIYPDLMMRVRIPDQHLTKLVWYQLRSPTVRQYFRDHATGTAGNMPKISGSTVRKVPIWVPPDDQVKDVVTHMDRTFARAERLEAEAARARKLLDRLESAILAKAFRGELVPQDPNDEPAEMLLERIRAEREAAPKPKRGRRAAS